MKTKTGYICSLEQLFRFLFNHFIIHTSPFRRLMFPTTFLYTDINLSPQSTPNVSIFLSFYHKILYHFQQSTSIDQSKETPPIRTIHHRSNTFILVVLSLSLVSFSISNQKSKLGRIISRRNLVPKRLLRYITFPSNTQQSSRSPRSIRGTFRLPRRRVVPSCSRPSPFR